MGVVGQCQIDTQHIEVAYSEVLIGFLVSNHALPTLEFCVCVNLASTKLGLCHDRVSTHRPVLPALLGTAVNKDEGLPIQVVQAKQIVPSVIRYCCYHPCCPLAVTPCRQLTKVAPTKNVQCTDSLFLSPSRQSANRGWSTMKRVMVSQ
jgi:hypothetical protein